jgi:homoserine kinase
MAGQLPPLSVRVPASTSNLGPGFDLLGLALALWLEVRITGRLTGRHELVRAGLEPSELPPPDEDLLLLAFERLRRAHPFEGHFRFEVRSQIPVGRGLGSSGAAIVAGLLLARALSGARLDLEELLALGIELEGHPDNVAAALAGGLTLCARVGAGAWKLVRAPLSPEIGFALAWPGTPLSTRRARAELPASVPFADAVENPRRLALLLEGLRTGARELVELGLEDRLHVRYRLPLLPGAEQALAAARAAGAWAAPLSGAGSGLVALGARGTLEPAARAMAETLRQATGAAEWRLLAPVLTPATASG